MTIHDEGNPIRGDPNQVAVALAATTTKGKSIRSCGSHLHEPFVSPEFVDRKTRAPALSSGARDSTNTPEYGIAMSKRQTKPGDLYNGDIMSPPRSTWLLQQSAPPQQAPLYTVSAQTTDDGKRGALPSPDPDPLLLVKRLAPFAAGLSSVKSSLKTSSVSPKLSGETNVVANQEVRSRKVRTTHAHDVAHEVQDPPLIQIPSSPPVDLAPFVMGVCCTWGGEVGGILETPSASSPVEATSVAGPTASLGRRAAVTTGVFPQAMQVR